MPARRPMRRVLLGVLALAALALIPRLYNTTIRGNAWRAYVVAIKSDLRNAADAQAQWADSTGGFAATIAELTGFVPSAGTTISMVPQGDSMLELRGTHERFDPAVQCRLTLTRASAEPTRRSDVTCDEFTDVFGRPRLAR